MPSILLGIYLGVELLDHMVTPRGFMPASAEDVRATGLIPGSGRSLGEGDGDPL